MLHTCVRKFDVTSTAQTFLGTKRSLNKALVRPPFETRSCLVAKFKILKLSHQKEILHICSIKSRRNKKRIALLVNCEMNLISLI